MYHQYFTYHNLFSEIDVLIKQSVEVENKIALKKLLHESKARKYKEMKEMMEEQSRKVDEQLACSSLMKELQTGEEQVRVMKQKSGWWNYGDQSS